MGKGAAQTFLPIVQVTGCYVSGTTTSTFQKQTLTNSEIVYPVKCISYAFTNSTNSSYSTTLTVNGETVTTATSPLVLNEEVTSTFDANITGKLNAASSAARRAVSSFYFSIPKTNKEPDYIIYCNTVSISGSDDEYAGNVYIYDNNSKSTQQMPSANTTLLAPGNYFMAQMRNSTNINNSIYIDNERYYFTGNNASKTSITQEITITNGVVRGTSIASPYAKLANVICLWKK